MFLSFLPHLQVLTCPLKWAGKSHCQNAGAVAMVIMPGDTTTVYLYCSTEYSKYCGYLLKK